MGLVGNNLRRFFVLVVAGSLAFAFLWQGLHFHGPEERNLQVEAACVLCKLAPDSEHSLNGGGLLTKAFTAWVFLNSPKQQKNYSRNPYGTFPIRAPPYFL